MCHLDICFSEMSFGHVLLELFGSSLLSFESYSHFLELSHVWVIPHSTLAHRAKVLILIEFILSSFPLMGHAFGIKSKNYVLRPRLQRVSPVFVLE